MPQTEQQQGGSAHPLFQITFEPEENNTPASQEKAEEIDQSVDELLQEQGFAEEGTPTTPVPPVKESPVSTTGDPEIDGLSQHALVALSYQKNKTIGEEVQIPKDLTAEGLVDLLTASKLSQERARDEEWEKERMASVLAKLEESGVSKKDFELLAHLKNGGSGQSVSRYLELTQWATEEVKTEEDMLETIKFAAELAGQKPEYVDSYIANNLIESAEIKKAFEEARSLIAAEAEKEYEADKERVRLLEQGKAEQWNSFVTNVKTAVTKPLKGGVTLSKADQQELVEFMTKKTVPTDVVINGRKVRKEITPYQEFGRKLQKDMDENLLFAYYAMKGTVGMINAAHQAANDKFIAAASAQANKPTGTKAKEQQMPEDSDGELLTIIGFG